VQQEGGRSLSARGGRIGKAKGGGERRLKGSFTPGLKESSENPAIVQAHDKKNIHWGVVDGEFRKRRDPKTGIN